MLLLPSVRLLVLFKICKENPKDPNDVYELKSPNDIYDEQQLDNEVNILGLKATKDYTIEFEK